MGEHEIEADRTIAFGGPEFGVGHQFLEMRYGAGRACWAGQPVSALGSEGIQEFFIDELEFEND